MRWFWRVFILVMLVFLLKTLAFSEPKAFISWPEGQRWIQQVDMGIKHWQSITQDLPASLEVEVRQLLKDFRSYGNGEEV